MMERAARLLTHADAARLRSVQTVRDWEAEVGW